MGRALPQLFKVTMAFRIVLLLTLALGYSQGHPTPCSKVDRVLKAANYAATKHKDQKSNEDETIPFINHPLGVANTLTNIGDIYNYEVLQAAILHDIVEYTDSTFEDLELGFGKEVTNIIKEVTPVEDGGTFTENSRLSQAAKELLLADNLWYLTALDERTSKPLSEDEVARFAEAANEVNKYRGTNKDIENMLDQLFAKRNVLKVAAS